MAQTQRQYDFQPGTKALSQQVDDELNNLVQAHNTLDTDVTTHKARVDNPHAVTAAQVGAYTKTESDTKFDTITNVDSKLASQKSDLAGTGRTTETIKGAYNSLNTHKMATTLDHPDGSVTTVKIADNAINTAKLADSSISTTKIADLNVTTGKIADLSVTTSKIADGAVTTSKIADGSISANKLDPNIIQDVELNTHRLSSVIDHPDGSVTYAKLSNDVQLRFTSLESDIGDPATLTTTNKTSAVAAINELDNEIGILSNMAIPYGTAAGTNAKTITFDPAPTAYVDGMAISFKNSTQNTGAVTINVNSLGAKTIKKSSGNDLASGNLKAGSIYTVRYNSTTGNFILQGEGGEYGTAGAADVLSGKTIGTDAGIINGTMPDRGAVTMTPGTTDQAINAGYHNGLGIVQGDADLVPGNILEGKNIFGVAGSLVLGKKYAIGTATTSGTTSNFQFSSTTSTQAWYSLNVTGLTFKPSVIIGVSSDCYVVYDEVSNAFYPKSVKLFNFNGTSTTVTVWNFKGDIAPASVVNGSFNLPFIKSNTTVTWLAIE